MQLRPEARARFQGELQLRPEARRRRFLELQLRPEARARFQGELQLNPEVRTRFRLSCNSTRSSGLLSMARRGEGPCPARGG